MKPAPAAVRPTEDILAAHRATAYFLRTLSNLTAEEFDAPADEYGAHTRREILSAVGNDARGYARLVEGIRTGVSGPRTYENPAERDEAVAWGSTLPPHALRHLVAHAAVHLSVEWRDLPAVDWGESGRTHDDRPLAVAAVPWNRAVEVWLAAIDLGAGGSFADIPPDVLARMAADAALATSGSFEFDDSTRTARARRAGREVAGALPDVVRWLHGRGDRYLTVSASGSGGADAGH